ncbi:sensor histidine kinase [Nonomuraea sp. NPDC003754]
MRYRLVTEAALALLVAALVVALSGVATWLAWPSTTTLTHPALVSIACALAAGLVLARRRWPLLALVGAALLFGRFIETGVALAVTAYGAAGRVPAKRHVPVCGLACVLPLAVCLVTTSQAAWQQVVVVTIAVSVICAAGPGLLGLVVVQHERLLRALRERNDVLERANELTASRARLLERSRIAQEMHDLIGHRLSLISLYAGGLELSATPPLAERARLVRDTAATAMRELRTVLDVLSADGEAAASPDGLTDATGTRADLERLAASSQAGGHAVSFAWTGPDVGQEHRALRLAAHRLVRESLTNLHRHAPGAPCRVEVRHGPHELALTVENGPPPAAAAPAETGSGSGLAGLGERVRLLGGTFSAGRAPGGGFRVEARLPWTDAVPSVPHPDVTPAARPRPPASTPVQRLANRIGMALLQAGGVALTAVLLVAVLAYLPLPSRSAMLDVGMANAALRALVGGSEPIAELAVAAHEPPRPPGTRCWYFDADYDVTRNSVRVVRYCLAGDRIVDRRVITVRIGPGE